MFTRFFKENESNSELTDELDEKNIPQHIAIIMDGNGRWAQKKHLPRIAGHRQGMDVVRDITKAASGLGVKVLTLYAFSTENWKRPTDEVDFLMALPVRFFNNFVPELIENNVRVNVMGYKDQLPLKTQQAVANAIEQTAKCTGMVLNFALNYGSRAEIITAVQNLAEKAQKGQLTPSEITEDVLSNAMMTANLAPYSDPDLLIRTSGEERISNFLLWQIAYSEFVFTDVLWPDYKPNDFVMDIVKYQQRNRRFGGLKEENNK